MLSFFGVTFVLFCFVFVFFRSLKPRPFVQSFFVLRYACAPTATRSLNCFFADNSMFARLGTDYEIGDQCFFAILEAMTTD